MAQNIDPNKLTFQYRNYINDPENRKNTYSVTYDYNGQKYDFIPESVINKGVNSGTGTTGVFNYFLDKNNLTNFFKNATPVDVAGSSSAEGDWLKNTVGASTKGYLIPSGSIDLGAPTIYDSSKIGNISGIGQVGDKYVYTTSGSGYDNGYVDQNGSYNLWNNPPPPSEDNGPFGGFLGSVANPIVNTVSSVWNSLGPVGQIAALYYGGSAIADAMGAAEAAPAIDAATQDAIASYAPQIGPGIQVASTDAAAGLNEAAAAAEAANAAQGLQLSQLPNLAEMGGGQGLAGGTTLANLADMGGAQGLAAGAASLPLIGAMDAGTSLGAGEALGAAGVGGALTPAAAGIGAGLGTSEAATSAGSALAGSTAANALTGAGAGAAAGSALSNILPYTTAAGLLSGYLQSSAAKDAAQIQADAAAKALAQQQKNFETINAQQAPYRAAGYNALNQIGSLTSGQTPQYDANGNIVKDANGNPVMTTGSGYLQHQFNAQDLAAGLAPNYDFMLQQGQMANQRAANAGGGGFSGNALQGLQKYTQDYAGNAYQNAFNNYQTQRSNIYNTLASIAGIGQTGQNATNTAATNATNAATQLGIGSAAAQAAGTTGSANAYTNAINNAANNYTLASILNQRGNVTMPTGG